MPVVEERRRLGLRLTVLQALATTVFVLLAISFWILQIIRHDTYEELAENNHQRTLSLRAPRGVVFDRDGRVLVENRNSYSISIVREHTEDLDQTIQLLAEVLGAEPAVLRQVVDRHRNQPAFRPITIVHDASLAQVAAVIARRLDFELPGLVVERVPTRRYPTNAMAAHLFGYVGEATETQIAQDAGVRSGDIVGQSGIERVYNRLLSGQEGARRVVVNSVGREIRTLEEIEPLEGTRLKLTLDADVQRAVEEAFHAFGYNGAAVLLEPNSGEVLAFASLPAYDPNAFASGIDRATWSALSSDELRPLNDRAIQGRYSPGSTFKMVLAAAALEEGLVTPETRVRCNGSATFYGRTFRCWNPAGHGAVDVREALERSCNVYFYTIGNMLGVDRIEQWAERLGLGVRSGVDLPNEVAGLVPSTDWKLRATGERWYPGETISVSIGQGQVSVTPVSMAVMMATLGNGGVRVTPHLLKEVDDGTGWKAVTPPAPQGVSRLKPETEATIREGLWMAVNRAGTGGRGRIPGRDVAGKTGTAQVISLAGGRATAGRSSRDLRDHGWFVFFAPAERPTIAGVIFAEHAEAGGNAASIARHAMETYFAKLEGRPLPSAPQPPAPESATSEALVAAAAHPLEETP